MSTLRVKNARRWFGDQRLGSMSVRVDGKKTATVRPQGVVAIPVPMGRHNVCVWQWRWFASPELEIEVTAAEQLIELEADYDTNSRGFLRRFVAAFLTPRSTLQLVRSGVEGT